LKVRSGRACLKGFVGALTPVLLLFASDTSASAQSVSDYTRGLDPLLQGMLARPQDLETTLRYSVNATAAGDIESAISTYERLLFYNPMLSSVRYELGILYFRLGSYEMARGYFESALQLQDMPADLRGKAEDFIATIDRKLQPDQFSGFAQAGVRYQSNASAGPGAQGVLASGKTFNSRFFAQPDWNGFGSFLVNYSHDFGNQRGDTFEASIAGYDAQQFRLNQFDIGMLELRAGPRFGIFPDGANGLTLKPYLVASGAVLGGAPYYGNVGGGGTVHATLANVAFDPYVEVVQQSFLNSGFYPLASGLSGTLSTAAFQAAGPVYSGLGWQTRLTYAHADDVNASYSYNRYTAELWLPWNFAVPNTTGTWTLTPNAGVSLWAYDMPDPTIDPLNTQRSVEWWVGLNLNIPVWKQFGIGLATQYHVVSSNIAVFSMKDLSFIVGPTLKF
jgi:hypothetical protein